MSAGAQRRQRESRRDFLALRPVVISVALEAPGLCVIRSGRMTSLASRNPRQQNVAGFGARQRFLVAAYASKAGVRPVVEFRMWHPARDRLCLRYVR